MEDILYYFHNGYHIVILSMLSYLITKNFKLNMYLFLKIFSFNYYYSFRNIYENPEYYKWKHMIKLTDTGHIANFLFYFFPNMLPISHNILFVITTGYYISLFLFNLKDTDDRLDSKIVNHNLQQVFCHMNHTIPYCIILYTIYDSKNQEICLYEFNDLTYYYSLLWVFIWFLCIYLPWVYLTGDYIYSVLHKDTSIKVKMTNILLVLLLVRLANEFGKFLQD